MSRAELRRSWWRSRRGIVVVTIGALLLLVIAGSVRIWSAFAAIAPLSQPSDVLTLLVGSSNAKVGSVSWKLDHGQRVDVLLLGYGGPAHAGPYLTDSMLILSLQDGGRSAVLISIPRDLIAPIPALPGNGSITARINNAYAIGVDRATFPDVRDQWKTATGGGDLAAATVAGVSGQTVDAWVAVDFNAFRDLVNAIGGIDVTVPRALDDPFFPAGETTAYTHIHFDAGPQRMNGQRALEYARSRQTTSDVDRTTRQRILLSAIRHRVSSLSALPTLVGALLAVQDDVRTNLRPPEMQQLLKTVSNLQDSQIRLASVDVALLDQVSTPDGYFVLVPKDQTYAQLRASIDATLSGQRVNPSG